MKCYFLVLLIILVNISNAYSSVCGCKYLRQCYRVMLNNLKGSDETACIEDAATGTSTITIFLKALEEYCGYVIDVISNYTTFEGRYLHEVVISSNEEENVDDENRVRTRGSNETKPTIVIDAGQEGGTEPVTFALFIIEQLVACDENEDMINKIRWVIMPSTNPDGQEYARNERSSWRKNTRKLEDSISVGVDISRNFGFQWESCPKVDNGFSPIYPGKTPASENETIFIQDVLRKYQNYTKLYLSLRRDGHALLLPYGFTNSHPTNNSYMVKVAADIAAKINQRAGGVHSFFNCTIFEFENMARCGNSVDYAHNLGIPLAYEMRVFDNSDNDIMSKFQTLPRGHEIALRNGYFRGIKELYNIIVKEKFQDYSF